MGYMRDVTGRRLDSFAVRDAAAAPGNRAVIFGDSWAALNLRSSGTPNTPGGVLFHSSRGWMDWANAFLRQRINVVKNAGLSGDSTTGMLSRFDAEVAPSAPDWVFLSTPGINDVKNGVATATTLANLAAIVAKTKAIGAKLVVIGLGPLSSPTATATQLQAQFEIMYWLRSRAATTRDLILIDIMPALADGTAANDWLNKSVAQYTADGTHLGGWGAARVGRMVADVMDPLIPPVAAMPFASAEGGLAITNRNLLLNPGMSGTGGTLSNGATGAMAANWTCKSSDGAAFAGTVACSKVARAPYTDRFGRRRFTNGEMQQVAITGAISKVQLYQSNLNVNSQWVPGDTVQLSMELFADPDWQMAIGSTPPGVCRLFLQAVTGGGSATVYGWDLDDSLPVTENPLDDVVLKTPPLVIPAGTTALWTYFQFTGLGTFRVGGFELRKNPTF